MLTSEERAELNQLRKEKRELRNERSFEAGGSSLCPRAKVVRAAGGAAAAARCHQIELLAAQHSVAWLCWQLFRVNQVDGLRQSG